MLLQLNAAPQVELSSCYDEDPKSAIAIPVDTTCGEEQTHIDEETKDGPPVEADEDVERPVGQAAREGDEPDEREEERDARHHLGVDEAADGPRVDALRVVEELAVDAGDDGPEGELREPQGEDDDALETHVGCFLCVDVGGK